MSLTWRSNRAGDLWAAYLGACRVGYAAEGRAGWLWHLTLVRPEGGSYAGREASLEAAQAAAAGAVGGWVAAAGLCPLGVLALPGEPRKGPKRPKLAPPRLL